MSPRKNDAASGMILDTGGLQSLIRSLGERGFEVIGPVLRDGAVMFDRIEDVVDLPRGVIDEQEPGSYRVRGTEEEIRFGFVVGPDGLKRWLFPPERRLFSVRRAGGVPVFEAEPPDVPPRAFLGVRACDLQALAIQDRVFLGGDPPDPVYEARRRDILLVAVNCSRAAATCFCVSMGEGPHATAGADIALTELRPSELLATAGTARGAAILGGLPGRPAGASDHGRRAAIEDAAARSQQRRIETSGIRGVLEQAALHPRWEDVASRCLACANCTLVCPTCFCSTVTDTSDLRGDHAERWRRWDSCFTADFSYIHGGSIRASTRSRYRQWLTHKLGTWIDQFGTSGCTGCGRCIAWCPAGIDLTAEAAALREPPAPPLAEDSPGSVALPGSRRDGSGLGTPGVGDPLRQRSGRDS